MGYGCYGHCEECDRDDRAYAKVCALTVGQR